VAYHMWNVARFNASRCAVEVSSDHSSVFMWNTGPLKSYVTLFQIPFQSLNSSYQALFNSAGSASVFTKAWNARLTCRV
jgi:hypothetical protein